MSADWLTGEKIEIFERMVTILEDEYRQLQSMQYVNSPLQAHFQTLSNEYKQQHSSKDPYTRVRRQGETLNEMLKLKDIVRKCLLELTPSPYQNRAESLFNFMKDEISIHEKGESLDIFLQKRRKHVLQK